MDFYLTKSNIRVYLLHKAKLYLFKVFKRIILGISYVISCMKLPGSIDCVFFRIPLIDYAH